MRLIFQVQQELQTLTCIYDYPKTSAQGEPRKLVLYSQGTLNEKNSIAARLLCKYDCEKHNGLVSCNQVPDPYLQYCAIDLHLPGEARGHPAQIDTYTQAEIGRPRISDDRVDSQIGPSQGSAPDIPRYCLSATRAIESIRPCRV